MTERDHLAGFLPQINKQKCAIYDRNSVYHIAIYTDEWLDLILATKEKQIKKGRVTSNLRETYDRFIKEHTQYGNREV